MKAKTILLLPFSYLYGLITWVRNFLYDVGLFNITQINEPTTICVGNLTTGGTGKTPHIEYLIRLLKENAEVATLSRGYGRKTSGFILAKTSNTAKEIGDEPLQFKLKFPEIGVAVGENRKKGIKKIMQARPEIKAILLDDAFQHRSIKPSISILLTEYSNLFFNDILLPAGNLREGKYAYKRADMIIVTKCPDVITPLEKKIIQKDINLLPYQRLYFSYVTYSKPKLAFPEAKQFETENILSKQYSVLALTAIANPEPFHNHLEKHTKEFTHLRFSDHHYFTKEDVTKIASAFANLKGEKKAILTTEKDLMRLQEPEIKEQLLNLPIFYISIEVDFFEKEKEDFDKQIKNHVRIN